MAQASPLTQRSQPKRLGIYGGSFDPVHYGHLILAECCREQCQLDTVWFMPAAIAPHKQLEPPADARQRVEMLELAIAGHPSLAVSNLELDRGGISYTVETLAEIHAAHPQTTLFFLMGADSLRDMPSWREPERICQLAVPVFVRRCGASRVDLNVLRNYVDDARLHEIQRCQVESPLVEFSSSDLRQRIRQGKSIRFRTPRAVEKYIEANGLY